jgi:hypothetical protein
MAGFREDYLLRLIDELREFVARAVALRDASKLQQALMTVVQAQEKLFARPAAQFAALSLDEQLRLVALDDPPAMARAKKLAYADILREAGKIYEARLQPDLAISACQLALQVTLTVALEDPAQAGELRPAIAELLPHVPEERRSPPVAEMLVRLA